MSGFLKAFAIGLATYYGYRAVDTFVVKPLAARANLPAVSGLIARL